MLLSKTTNIHSDFFIPYLTLLCGNILIFLLGLKDDLVGVKYSHKFRIQLLVAICTVLGGTYLNHFCGLLGIGSLPIGIGIFLTIFFIIFFINAFNFIDGIDGLASGIALLAFITFGCCFILENKYIYSSLSFVGAGTLLPFMRYNMSGFPRKIFMGDTGSLTLGLILSFLAIHFVMYADRETNFFSCPLAIASAPLFLPMFDAVRVICMRLLEKKTPFAPDRKHIHHKLLDCGYSHRKTTFILLTADAAIIILNITLACFADINLILCIDIAAGIILNHTLNKLRKKKQANI